MSILKFVYILPNLNFIFFEQKTTIQLCGGNAGQSSDDEIKNEYFCDGTIGYHLNFAINR